MKQGAEKGGRVINLGEERNALFGNLNVNLKSFSIEGVTRQLIMQ